jgi:hypothetical protein
LGGGTLADMASAELANYMPSTWAKKTLDFVMKELQAFKCIAGFNEFLRLPDILFNCLNGGVVHVLPVLS